MLHSLVTIATILAAPVAPLPDPTPPPAQNVDLAVLTVYDTALCPVGTLCPQGNGDGYFASMIPVTPRWYGKMAACPAGLLGANVTVVGMELYCGDSFGPSVETVECDEHGCFMRVDVFWPVAEQGIPDWNGWHAPVSVSW